MIACRFFARGACEFGDRCRFSHDAGVATTTAVNGDAATAAEPNARRFTARRAVPKPPRLPDLTKESLKGAATERLYELQHNEVRQLQKRFTNAVAVVQERPTFDIQIALAPSDSDFPYILSHLILQFVLPARYPCDLPTVRVLNDIETIPPSLARKIERALAEHVRRRRYQLMIRPTLLWLDKNLEALLTPERAATITESPNILIIQPPASPAPTAARAVDAAEAPIELPRKVKKTDVAVSYETETKIAAGPASAATEDANAQEGGDDDDAKSNEDTDHILPMTHPYAEAAHQGIQLRLMSPSFENIGFARTREAKLLVRCERCRVESEVVLQPDVARGEPCMRCKHPHMLRFRPATCHANFASLGYIDASGATPVDLIRAEFTVSCGNCSTMFEASDIIAAERTCFKCHHHTRFAFGSVLFFKLGKEAMAFDSIVKKQANTSAATKEKQLGFTVGTVLPEKGTCKHYRRSHRWFKFPCCNRAYPCDMCHDEQSDGHILQYANQQICGLCSTLQPLNKTGECIACRHDMTGQRMSAYWEGGEGCRDPAKMSRNETRKSKGLAKTTSQKMNRVGVAGKERHERRSDSAQQ